jgi:prepilin peptidase CpaA
MEPNLVVAAIWGATLCAAALSDLRSFRIANVFPAIIILLFAVMHGLSGFSGALWANLLHFLLALAVGMALFGRGWVGGGDAKLYAAAALWFNWKGAAALIFLTGVAGALLALLFVSMRMAGLRKNVPKEDRRIPYGVAIAAGAILAAAWSGWDAIFPAFSL